MPIEVTQKEIAAAIGVIGAVAEAIRELGEVPSGVLYARVMEANPSITAENWNKIVAILVGAGLVKCEYHLLRWVGPKKGETR